ncbi:unnamed protein product [Lactuca saligna]|uniref:Gelsolin-like domain-containing protein n=1 Tax=Lactuca saligna TaxID=75948 RepID=A0AA35YEJ7_LACSI|nr:unnamed protein product [Lactuca saligna]
MDRYLWRLGRDVWRSVEEGPHVPVLTPVQTDGTTTRLGGAESEYDDEEEFQNAITIVSQQFNRLPPSSFRKNHQFNKPPFNCNFNPENNHSRFSKNTHPPSQPQNTQPKEAPKPTNSTDSASERALASYLYSTIKLLLRLWRNNGFYNRDGGEVVFVSDKTGGSGSYPPTHLSSPPPSLTYALPVRVQEVSMICFLALEAAVLHLVAVASTASALEETRGKVAALLKQQGAFAKGQTKTAPVEEEVPHLLGENGKIEVWRIDGEEKTELPKEDIGKFYSGDCYICLYSYHSDEKKEDHYLCCWIGKDSIQGRMHQGKEAPQFVAIFHPMVVLKGGLSSGYKNYIVEKGLHDETYSPDTAALIEILGTSVHNNKAQQVERSGVPVKFSREVKESLAFWLALGGKQSYSSRKVTQEIICEPHLFEVISNKEDILILDTHAEVIVWVGHLAQSTEKQNTFETGKKYVELAASMDSLSPSVILYRVTEGNEPCFFTTYFSWDPAKTTAHGNAFHKKAVQLFGLGCVAEPPGNKLSGATQRASAMAALTSAFSKSTTAPKTPQHGPPPRMLALILTGSPDCSILAIDIETGSPVSYGWMFIQLGIIFNIHTVTYGWMFQLTRIGRDAVLYVESLIESIMGGLEGLINILDSEGASTRSHLKLQMAFDGQERYMKRSWEPSNKADLHFVYKDVERVATQWDDI